MDFLRSGDELRHKGLRTLIRPGDLGEMKREKFPWKREYQFVEPGINAEGVRIYPFDPVFPVDVSCLTTSGHRLVRMNRHEFLEVLYISSGDTQIQVRSRYLDSKKGDVVVMGHLPPPRAQA